MARFTPVNSVTNHVKLDKLLEASTPPCGAAARRNVANPPLPANLRTAEEIATWASNIAAQRAQVVENTDNNLLLLNSGAEIPASIVKSLVAKLNALNVEVFFKLEVGARNRSFIDKILLVPSSKSPNWRLVPVTFSNLFDSSEYYNQTLTNGVECLLVQLNG